MYSTGNVSGPVSCRPCSPCPTLDKGRLTLASYEPAAGPSSEIRNAAFVSLCLAHKLRTASMLIAEHR